MQFNHVSAGANAIDLSPVRNVREKDANDLALDVGIILIAFSEFSVKHHLRIFQERVDEIRVISTNYNKISSQLSNFTEEQIAAGLYQDENGDLKSVLDHNEYNEDQIPLPDPASLSQKPISNTVDLKIETSEGEILSISFTYTIGHDDKGYYIKITDIKIGDFQASNPDGEDPTHAGIDFKDLFSEGEENILDDEIYIDGKTSLDKILKDIFDKLTAQIEKKFGGYIPSDGENYKQPIVDSLNENQEEIVKKINHDIFTTAESLQYTRESIDAIFTQNGGQSSKATGTPNGHTSIEVPLGGSGLKLKLDIYWEYDALEQDYNFEAHISVPGYTNTDYSPEQDFIYSGSVDKLLNVASIEDAKQQEGETESEFLTRQIEVLIKEATEKLNSYAAIGIEEKDENIESTTFWKVLFGDLLLYDVTDKRYARDDINFSTDLNDSKLNDLGGNETDATPFFEKITLAINSALRDGIAPAVNVSTLKFPENPDNKLQKATDGTSPIIPGFNEPNLLVTDDPSKNISAFLEEVLGEEIFKNGFAYTKEYWEKTIIPQLKEVVVPALAAANEITMSKIRRLIETINAYLQVVITDLQKHYQALNAISNGIS